MRREVERRGLILGAGASALAGGGAGGIPTVRAAIPKLAVIERSTGGRLGVFAFAHWRWAVVSYRPRERFPMCSTFKLSLAGAILQDADRGRVRLDKWIPYGPTDLLEYAPITRAHVEERGMKLVDLCQAAVEVSDNTAANLLLQEFGGPTELTGRWRSWGDDESRLDRIEPGLNSAIPGDKRDTTTPLAMFRTLEALLKYEVLKPASTALLRSWMQSSKTGLDKLRAGFPSDFVVGDKTGNNAKDTMGDLAWVETPDHRDLLMACYLTGAKVDQRAQAVAFAEVARIVAAALGMASAHG